MKALTLNLANGEKPSNQRVKENTDKDQSQRLKLKNSLHSRRLAAKWILT